jgi:ABC-2 type transport system ATP-binding protein
VTPVVLAESLCKSFGGIRAVEALTLQLDKGELFGLVGSDGAGKTTTIRMLTGLLEPTSGNADILGHPCRALEPVRGEIGYMSQRFGLYSDLTVTENIRFYADIFNVPRKDAKEQMESLLHAANLEPFRNRRAGNLSGGMKQKLGLCCALIHTPKILFLDEPTNGVDPVSRREFWRILYGLLSEGVTIFVSTAYLDEADRCHRVGLIHQGRLIACDTPANLKLSAGSAITAPQSLEDVFFSLISNERGAEFEAAPTGQSRRQPVAPASPAVSVKGLSRYFGSFVAVNGIDLEVAQGEIFGFLGPNGAGKSTTIRMLCGILKPTAGEGTVAGCDIMREPEKILAT